MGKRLVGVVLLGLVPSLWAAGCGDDNKSPSPAPNSDSGPKGWRAAVGADGMFVQTFDDQTWRVLKVANVDLHGVACVGNVDGWAVGAQGFVGHTRDGGDSWSTQDAGVTSTLRAVHFVEDRSTATSRFVGLVAGDQGALSVTTDGGESWNVVDTQSQVTLRATDAALNAKLLVVVGDQGSVLRSSDAGQSWQSSAVPNGASLTGVALDPQASLILAVDDSGAIWASRDQAQSFAKEYTAGAALHAVAIDNSGLRALATGDSGTLLRRDANGVWSTMALPTSANLFAALITHADHRDYLAGADGTVLTSTDHGSTWSLVNSQTKVPLYSLEDLDPY